MSVALAFTVTYGYVVASALFGAAPSCALFIPSLIYDDCEHLQTDNNLLNMAYRVPTSRTVDLTDGDDTTAYPPGVRHDATHHIWQ